jgi:hypothetical protein
MMAANLDKFKADLKKLLDLGDQMELDLNLRTRKKAKVLDPKHEAAAEKLAGSFEKSYQRWYSEASGVVKQLLPDRLQEFTQLYYGDPKRKVVSNVNYSIQDWLVGMRSATNPYTGEKFYDDFGVAAMKFYMQLEILRSVEARFESSLLDIAQLVRADLFDSELDGARELLKHGFGRAAGALAGVVIERHLAQVAINHNLASRKKDPSIADFNDLLKASSVIDTPVWRQIQRLGDIRNLCDHNKQRDPTPEEVAELLDGAEKLSKTLF